MTPQVETHDEVLDAVFRYADGVRSGEILAGKWIKLAVKRFYDDLETGAERGIYFDEGKAAKALEFFPRFLRFSKGRWAGKPFHLQPWQSFIVGNLFGWHKADGTRRFRRCYVKVARKNGKSELMAGIGLYMEGFDGEHGAEVYSVATKKDQAALIFKAAKQMVRLNPVFGKYFKSWKHEIEFTPGAGTFKALGSDADTLDGLNPYLTIVDEYHAHKTDEVYDVMWSAMGARENPMQLVITTAGVNLTCPCYDMERDCKGVLEGFFRDDEVFIAIFELDLDDLKAEEYTDEKGQKKTRFAWATPENYPKANPNIGVSVKESDLLADALVAVRRISKRKEFLTKKCNVWVNAPDTWIKSEHWTAAGRPIDMEALKGRPCFAGMDLAQSQDFTGFSLLFPMDDGTLTLLTYTWIPEVTVEDRVASGLHTLTRWIDEELVFTTEGNATDYNVIQAFVEQCTRDYQLKYLYYDPYNATQLVLNLSESGLDCTGITQSPAHVGEATQQFELAILHNRLNHGNNPVLGWMINNVALKRYPSGAAMVNKNRSTEKVDCVTSSVLAMKCYLEKREAGFQPQWLV